VSSPLVEGRLELPQLGRRVALWENVLPVLRHAVLSGRLAAGTRLQPEKLARELGVSRGPVTEALRRLHEEDLVTFAPNGRPFVRGLTHRYVRDFYAFRSSLDLQACKFALARSPQLELGELRAAVNMMWALQAAGNMSGLADVDMRFHRQLIALAHNAVLDRVWANIADFSLSLLTVTDSLLNGARTVAAVHAAIVEALGARDLVAVEEAIATHYRLGEELLVTSELVQPDDEPGGGPAPRS
jgi:DNA-binding GntR family transcriptional regulator